MGYGRVKWATLDHTDRSITLLLASSQTQTLLLRRRIYRIGERRSSVQHTSIRGWSALYSRRRSLSGHHGAISVEHRDGGRVGAVCRALGSCISCGRRRAHREAQSVQPGIDRSIAGSFSSIDAAHRCVARSLPSNASFVDRIRVHTAAEQALSKVQAEPSRDTTASGSFRVPCREGFQAPVLDQQRPVCGIESIAAQVSQSSRVDGPHLMRGILSLLTPWLMVNDGKRTTLNYISLTFTYRGDDIIDIDWNVDCTCLE